MLANRLGEIGPWISPASVQMDRLDQIDEFESLFRRSEREDFVYSEIPIESVAVVTGSESSDPVRESVARFLPRINDVADWHSIGSADYQNVAELIERVEAQRVDLLVTRRHLGEEMFSPLHSLGVYLDELTQRTSIPVPVSYTHLTLPTKA